ncbi:MAG: hypothetical protein NC093_00720 [Alistipes sp.]|nr:hypothetical protein [Alistipes sp.]
MFNTDLLLAAQTQEIANPNLFPFSFKLHLVFCAIALIFFGWRFSAQKKPFQLIFAIAIPLSLAIWLNDNKTWFYTLGIIEVILILAAIVSCFIFKGKKDSGAASESVMDKSAAGDENTAESEEAGETDEDRHS